MLSEMQTLGQVSNEGFFLVGSVCQLPSFVIFDTSGRASWRESRNIDCRPCRISGPHADLVHLLCR